MPAPESIVSGSGAAQMRSHFWLVRAVVTRVEIRIRWVARSRGAAARLLVDCRAGSASVDDHGLGCCHGSPPPHTQGRPRARQHRALRLRREKLARAWPCCHQISKKNRLQLEVSDMDILYLFSSPDRPTSYFFFSIATLSLDVATSSAGRPHVWTRVVCSSTVGDAPSRENAWCQRRRASSLVRERLK